MNEEISDLEKYESIIMFLFGVVLGFILSMLVVQQFMFPLKTNIPSQDMVTSFCRDKGFKNGWLSSSSCGANEVQCHKKFGQLDEYKCVDWNDLENYSYNLIYINISVLYCSKANVTYYYDNSSDTLEKAK